MERKGEELEERLLDFAARVGKVVDALPNTRLGRHIAGQLVRSGTSPASNYAEACAAESKRELITGLIYFDDSRPSLAEALNLPEEPLGLLSDDQIRPSKEQLAQVMAGLK